ncbi:hypothetical protein IEQ34_018927 [Dendrobium chrysotoxum]|uniref:Uncharacterized protein n=1 Tax=Dendrobium chrysotoxum TaxID=161865 RepID=A0AAV7G749_DENCH|nr:hypothetical protein IEQ34_018927 [Dendrobium chrysotoxum]
MKSKANGSMQRAQMVDRVNGDGPNWILIAGGALLSTLSIRIGCKLKQALEAKALNKDIRGNKSIAKPRLGGCQLHSNLYQFAPDKDCCYHFISGHANGGVQIKQVSDNPISKESELSLPLVKISAAELNKDSNGGTLWASSPELLELPHKPFHHSTGSDSPSISESGSDIYTKREVINKLRQQLKRRDEMIMDMQNQIADLQNSLCTQMSQVVQTQSQLDSANQELFESEREIQRLRKVIANHCILKSNSPEKLTSVANWRPESANGFPDTVNDLDLHCFRLQKVKGDEDRVMLLKKELGDLSAVIEGKDFLLQSYKEQKSELCSTIKALEHRLESHQQNIF